MENAPSETLALLLPRDCLGRFESFYQDVRLPSPNPYVSFFAKTQDGVAISVYSKLHDGCHKVLFQGLGSEKEASLWGEYSSSPKLFDASSLAPKQRKESEVNLYPQIGSDEVGTGDFFGPVCVVASYVQEKDLPFLSELGVTDSKKLSDESILSIGKALIKRIPYSSLSLAPSHYNELYAKGENLNSIKAKMHNRCLLNLAKRFPSAHLYQDQFAEPALYYSYLSNEAEVQRGIVFKTKGELSFPSVASASILARYSFLKKMEAMSKEYDFSFPFGSGEQVEEALKEFLESHSMDEVKKVAKTNFKTLSKVVK